MPLMALQSGFQLAPQSVWPLPQWTRQRNACVVEGPAPCGGRVYIRSTYGVRCDRATP